MATFSPPENYNPLTDPHYMSKKMLQYFEYILYSQLENVQQAEAEISAHMVENGIKESDFLDQSFAESTSYVDYAYHVHEDSLLKHIQEAIKRIQNGTYGYCAATGKPIGVRRLLAAPQANYCVDVQAKKEKRC